MASSAVELQRAEQVARGRALEVLNAGSAENQSTLSSLQEVVRRTAEASGVRIVVLVSPGFLMQTPEAREAVMELIDRAVRSNIVIHTLDVKGLATSGVSGDSRRPGSPNRLRLSSAEASAQGEVMAEFAYGTGGIFFHNSNDLDEGFRRTADPQEYIYVLGFSPQKLDGKFHKLKVTFSSPEKLSSSARGLLRAQAGIRIVSSASGGRDAEQRAIGWTERLGEIWHKIELGTSLQLPVIPITDQTGR